MKKTLRLVLAAAFLTFPAGAGAAVWSAVLSNEKMRAEIDLASFMRQGDIVTAWDREVYFMPEQARPGDFYFKSSKSLVRYSCDARTSDLLMRVYYDEDGGEIKTISAAYYGRLNYVVPDTDNEKKFEYVCKYQKPVEKKTVSLASKKGKKPKKTGTAESSGKEAPGATNRVDSKAKLTEKKDLPKPPPSSLPIRKPSGILH